MDIQSARVAEKNVFQSFPYWLDLDSFMFSLVLCAQIIIAYTHGIWKIHTYYHLGQCPCIRTFCRLADRENDDKTMNSQKQESFKND